MFRGSRNRLRRDRRASHPCADQRRSNLMTPSDEALMEPEHTSVVPHDRRPGRARTRSPGFHNVVQRPVELPVTAAVQPVPHHPAAAGLQRAGPGQGRERRVFRHGHLRALAPRIAPEPDAPEVSSQDFEFRFGWTVAADSSSPLGVGVGRADRSVPTQKAGLLMDPDRSAKRYTLDNAHNPNCSH